MFRRDGPVSPPQVMELLTWIRCGQGKEIFWRNDGPGAMCSCLPEEKLGGKGDTLIGATSIHCL